jgi:hypothetical protein
MSKIRRDIDDISSRGFGKDEAGREIAALKTGLIGRHKRLADRAGFDWRNYPWFQEALIEYDMLVSECSADPVNGPLEDLSNLEYTMRYAFDEAGFDPEPFGLVPTASKLHELRRRCYINAHQGDLSD